MDNIKLSAKALEALKLLKAIDKNLNKFKELQDDPKITKTEKHLVGSIVGGIYSPLGNFSSVFSIGHKTQVKGLRAQITDMDREKNESPLATLLAGRHN